MSTIRPETCEFVRVGEMLEGLRSVVRGLGCPRERLKPAGALNHEHERNLRILYAFVNSYGVGRGVEPTLDLSRHGLHDTLHHDF